MECRSCHTPLPGEAKFCLACGVTVTDSGATVLTSLRDPTTELQDRLAHALAGRYRVQRLLGAGGMAAVFLADDLALERPVAIKVLPPGIGRDGDLVERFQREAKMAAKLDHPHIIPIYRVESEAGLNYFVMKYVPGRSLEAVLDSREPLPYDVVQRILAEAAAALGHAHARGVVHRDVKPANIMLDADDRVVLTDFGISKAADSSQLTQTGTVVGTPHYMAPEQALGKPVDGRADQYALGVIGYHMLTGDCPFDGDSAHTIIYRHIHEQPRPIGELRPEVPPPLADAVIAAMAKNPEQRFGSMEEFAAAIRANASSPVIRRGTRAISHTEHVRRRRATLRSGAVLVACVVVAIAVAVATGLVERLGIAAGQGRVASAQPVPEGERGRPERSPALDLPRSDSSRRLMLESPPPQESGRQRDTGSAGATESAHDAASGAPPRSASAKRAARREPPPSRRDRAAAPAPKQEVARLTVASEPYGVLYIDGVEVGDTPVANFALEIGRKYQVRVEREGYKAKRETITVSGPNPIRKSYVLEPGDKQ